MSQENNQIVDSLDDTQTIIAPVMHESTKFIFNELMKGNITDSTGNDPSISIPLIEHVELEKGRILAIFSLGLDADGDDVEAYVNYDPGRPEMIMNTTTVSLFNRDDFSGFDCNVNGEKFEHDIPNDASVEYMFQLMSLVEYKHVVLTREIDILVRKAAEMYPAEVVTQ